MKDRPAYLPFYIRDFFSDPNVLRMTWTQQAVYWRMLCVSWEMGPLPASDQEVARMINQESLELDVGIVRKLAWKTDGDGNSTNPRLERERSHWFEVHNKRKSGGREGNKRRWNHPEERLVSDRAQTDTASDADRSPTEPQSDSDRNTQAQAQEQEQPNPSASLRSAGASAPRVPGGAGKPSIGPGSDSHAGGLPGIEITPPKGKREPTQAQVDGFVARGVWLRCWLERFGKPCTSLSGAKSAAVRTAFVRLQRDEAELERLVRAFLAAPPYKHRENPDTLAFLESLDSVRAGLNGKHSTRPSARERQESEVAEGLAGIQELSASGFFDRQFGPETTQGKERT